ncbi:MAG: hypothetical protein IPP90_22640 [Gemmatimonadaceae bacterium]|nr:hypothetical protein [Gemmatimonadaceae bacterium]
MNSNSRAQEAFYESEAALRLVDQEIHELRGATPSSQRFSDMSLNELPQLLERANEQILRVLAQVREKRSATGGVSSAFLGDIEGQLAEVATLLDPAA